MDPVWLFLLSIAAIFLIGALGEVTFQRTNIPDVIWLLFAGIVLGPIFGLAYRQTLQAVAPYFAALTLVVVLFEGGSALRLRELSLSAPRAGVLALLSFTFSVVTVAIVSMLAKLLGALPSEWTWMHGFLFGTILGGPSAMVVMPAMAQARLAPKLANLMNLESSLTDAFCVVGTVALIDVLLGIGADDPVGTLTRSFVIGLTAGAAAGAVWIVFLGILRSAEHAYPITISALLILYVVIDHFGGSAALGILTVAILVGNAAALSKVFGLPRVGEIGASVRGFHRQLAFIIKSFFFVFMGAMLGPPWGPLLLGLSLGIVLFLARYPAARVATLGAGLDSAERQMVLVALPRGMAAGVLATMPAQRGVPGTENVPLSVFAAVLSTILIFAVGFPLVQRKLPRAEPGSTAVPLPAGSAQPSVAPPPMS